MPRLLSSFCSCVIAALARLVIVLVAEPIFTPATFISVSHGSQALAKKIEGCSRSHNRNTFVPPYRQEMGAIAGDHQRCTRGDRERKNMVIIGVSDHDGCHGRRGHCHRDLAIP